MKHPYKEEEEEIVLLSEEHIYRYIDKRSINKKPEAIESQTSVNL